MVLPLLRKLTNLGMDDVIAKISMLEQILNALTAAGIAPIQLLKVQIYEYSANLLLSYSHATYMKIDGGLPEEHRPTETPTGLVGRA